MIDEIVMPPTRRAKFLIGTRPGVMDWAPLPDDRVVNLDYAPTLTRPAGARAPAAAAGGGLVLRV
ncbi:MAG: hypothetical protein ACRD0K_28265 [Egibacteraceae bacterium]